MDVERDPLFLLSLFAPLPLLFGVLVMLVIPFVMYVIARWRAQRDQAVDSQIGIKVALGFFAVTAFQLVLFGATLFVYAILASNIDSRSGLYRAAFGLMIPAGIVLAVHAGMLGRTNQDRFPTVRRMFAGYNLLATGVLGFIGLVLAFEALFKKGSAGEQGRVAAAMVLVYGSAWAAVGWRFVRSVLDEAPATATPGAMPPPGPTVQPPQGPSLPSLGGGSFPPIDR